MNALEEIYYIIGRIEGLKSKESVELYELNFIKSVLDSNLYFLENKKTKKTVRNRNFYDPEAKADVSNDYTGIAYEAFDPYYDSNENPWIDFFGEGEEAFIAYWNTD